MAFLREHGDAVEADLAFRGFDLLDMWRGTLSPRKVEVLIRGLPPDSATRMAMNDGQPLWSRTDHILADLIDRVAALTWVVGNKDVAERNRTQYPDPYPRPGDQPKTSVVTAEKLREFRERTRKR